MKRDVSLSPERLCRIRLVAFGKPASERFEVVGECEGALESESPTPSCWSEQHSKRTLEIRELSGRLERRGIRVVSFGAAADIGPAMHPAPLSASELVLVRARQGVSLAETCVIVSAPSELEAGLDAGIMIALKGSGASALAAADLVIPLGGAEGLRCALSLIAEACERGV